VHSHSRCLGCARICLHEVGTKSYHETKDIVREIGKFVQSVIRVYSKGREGIENGYYKLSIQMQGSGNSSLGLWY
jgi:hypothetical protein